MSSSKRKYIKAILNLIIAIILTVAVIWLTPKVIVFFMPFIIGWIIALLASPLVRLFEVKLKIKRKAGSVVVIVVVIGLIVLVGYLVCAKLIREIASFIQDIPSMWASLETDFNSISQNLSVVYDKLPADIQNTLNSIAEQANELAGTLVSRLSSPTLEAVGNFAKQLPTLIIGVIMCLLSSYLFVSERDQITTFVKRYTPEWILLRFRLMKQSVVKAVGGYFKAQLKIEIWIYLFLVIGFLILRIDYAILIAFGVAIMDFLPFFGTGTIMVPWAIVKLLSADYKMTIGLLLIWGISQLFRQIIQPKIVGDSIGVPPIPTLFLLYIGYMASGVLGMIVAVPVGLILWTMYEAGAFETTKNSILILSAGLNHFRRLTPEDKAIISSYRRECEEELEREQMKEEQKDKAGRD